MHHPRLRHQRFIEEWPPLRAPGIELGGQLFAHRDGRRHAYFTRPGDNIRGREYSRNVNRVVFREWEDGTQFLGMSVETKLRGIGLGKRLLGHFMDTLEANGKNFLGSGTIYKPLVALTLARAGLQPASQGTLVEILPRSAFDESEVPKIQILSSTEGAEFVDHSDGGQFYELVPPEDVPGNYPVNNAEMIVAINTRYSAPK